MLRNPGAADAIEAVHERLGAESGSLDSILQRVGGDEKLLRQMIRTFLRETPIRMLAIQKALVHKKGGELSSYAHALKGSAGIFGASRAAQYAQSLEDLGRIGDFQESNRVYGFLQEEIAKLQQNLRGYAKQEGAKPSTGRKEAKSRTKASNARRP